MMSMLTAIAESDGTLKELVTNVKTKNNRDTVSWNTTLKAIESLIESFRTTRWKILVSDKVRALINVRMSHCIDEKFIQRLGI